MRNQAAWIIERLDARPDRAAFSCGEPQLDAYLQRFARQNEKSGLSQHFVAVATAGDSRVLGYYALSAGEDPERCQEPFIGTGGGSV